MKFPPEGSCKDWFFCAGFYYIPMPSVLGTKEYDHVE